MPLDLEISEVISLMLAICGAVAGIFAWTYRIGRTSQWQKDQILLLKSMLETEAKEAKQEHRDIRVEIKELSKEVKRMHEDSDKRFDDITKELYRLVGKSDEIKKS